MIRTASEMVRYMKPVAQKHQMASNFTPIDQVKPSVHQADSKEIEECSKSQIDLDSDPRFRKLFRSRTIPPTDR